MARDVYKRQVQIGADLLQDLAALDEGILHLGVGDQVHIALTVTHLGIGQAVELLGQGAQALGQQGQLGGANAQLTGLGAEPVSYTHLDVYKRQDKDRAPHL